MRSKVINISILFLLIACAITGYKLFNKVVEAEKFSILVVKQEKEVKQKLLFLADVEKIAFENNGNYIGSWDTLRAYLDTGKIYITETTETIKELYLGRDTSIYHTDTLAIVNIKDSLSKVTNYDFNDISLVPNTKEEFELYYSTNEDIQLLEIKDPNPINPRRTTGELDTLKIGSRTEQSILPNWK